MTFSPSGNKQRGGVLIAVLCTLAVLLIIGGAIAMMFVSSYNKGIGLDAGLKAQYESNQNNLSTYYQKVAEAAQVPGMMTDDLKKVAEGALAGRYGADGSRAVFQAIREQNPQVSEKLYVNLQNLIEASRDSYKAGQDTLIDKVRVATVEYGKMPGGFIMGLMGFPRVPLDKYKPILTQQVEDVYQAGKESGPVQLRPAAK